MILFFILLLGLSIGSFLNVLVDRLPAGESILGRSHCDHCKKQLQWIDLIPVLSWIVLGGKCRRCKKKLSVWYPIVELTTGLAFVFLTIVIPAKAGIQLNGSPIESGMTISLLGIVSVLIVIFFADFKYHIIPDEATIGVVLFSIPLVLFRNVLLPNVIAGLGLMLSIYFLYYITKGRGMGFGDVKLAAAMGFLLGFKAGFLALYISFILGGVFSLFLILFKKRGMKSKIAFGPFMVLGTLVMLFFKNDALRLVTTLFGF